jgi:hypothetical protein
VSTEAPARLAEVVAKSWHDGPVAIEVPNEFAPSRGEAAVLSMLAVRDGSSWTVASGSLLTVPIGVALTSWKRWGELQPGGKDGRRDVGFDFGPIFCAEPFPNVRVVRAVIEARDWSQIIDGLAGGTAYISSCPAKIKATGSTSTVFLGSDGASNPHLVVEGARRPVRGVVLKLEHVTMPATDGIWSLGTPTYLQPGADLGAMSRHRNMANWAEPLIGISWPAGKIPPPRCFVVGKIQSSAWIVRIKPSPEDQDSLVVAIGWEETQIDPLGCSLLGRSELDGLPLLVRHVPLSDFPGALSPTEPRETSWRERTLDVTLPHGPRRAAWGFMLLGPEGELLDDRTVAPRVEKVSVTVHPMGSPPPTIAPEPPPSELERDSAVEAAVSAEAAARHAAAHRRISTAGQLEEYLRWRFSCRAGELLLLDSGLFGQHHREEEVVAFLESFSRPVRALVRGQPRTAAQTALLTAPGITAKGLPGGGKILHDRVWIVGDTAVLVGASPGDFLADPAGKPRRATTATDLPLADAAVWRELFDQWWSQGGPAYG